MPPEDFGGNGGRFSAGVLIPFQQNKQLDNFLWKLPIHYLRKLYTSFMLKNYLNEIPHLPWVVKPSIPCSSNFSLISPIRASHCCQCRTRPAGSVAHLPFRNLYCCSISKKFHQTPHHHGCWRYSVSEVRLLFSIIQIRYISLLLSLGIAEENRVLLVA